MVKETKFYDTLGVGPDASEGQLKTAYKKGALKHHPGPLLKPPWGNVANTNLGCRQECPQP